MTSSRRLVFLGTEAWNRDSLHSHLFEHLSSSFLHWFICLFIFHSFADMTNTYCAHLNVLRTMLDIWNIKTKRYGALPWTNSLSNQGIRHGKRQFKCCKFFKKARGRKCNWARRWESQLCQRAVQERMRMHKKGIRRFGGNEEFSQV